MTFATTAVRTSWHPIREASLLSGLPESTLRYYESIGIIGPISRDPSSGHRRYSDADVDTLLAIACINTTGMSLNQMREYIEHRQGGPQAASHQVELLAQQACKLEQEMKELELRRQYVEVKTQYWQAIGRNDVEMAQEVLDRGEGVISAIRSLARGQEGGLRHIQLPQA
ncbi:hypothetical protein KIM372_10850 [Bombiscardovia nodaiensis]|uniref:HTH merR-type domain-containing protein n=1 Tax=Bombiscardovia nodaiensis TaxID=2932181 RepID=A0ABN6SD95_9BIFI|nr:hypothetical protein KIM372_10850 [Bombiscardovia nodaiensis]